MDDPVAAAILQTLTYADLFDYAMTPDEVHRFLIRVRASRGEIQAALNDPSRLNGNIARREGFLTLPGRQGLVAARARLHASAQRQFRRARIYGRVLAHLPFVRMVAVTGGLAMENARDGDTDYMLVTEPGRVWLVRGMAVALVRIAHLFGDHLCPNMLISSNTLGMTDQNLYTAHEVVQMIPLYGMDLYRQMRALNAWTDAFLPNAVDHCQLGEETPLHRAGAWFKRAIEWALGGAIGDRIERWERKRKIAKLSQQIPQNADDVTFSEDMCRGFFSGHKRRVLSELGIRDA